MIENAEIVVSSILEDSNLSRNEKKVMVIEILDTVFSMSKSEAIRHLGISLPTSPSYYDRGD